MRKRSRGASPWGGGGGVLPYKSLTGICRWMGSHFHDWTDYNGVAFSIELILANIFGFFWVRQFFIFTVSKRTRIGPFIRGKIRRVLNKTRTFRINGTFRLK